MMRNGPDYIQLYPTLRCNRSCEFCFNRSLPRVQDMSLESFRDMLVRLTALSVKTIDIIGGEPTLHPDIVAFIHAADRNGFFVNLSSNGTNVELLEDIVNASCNVTVGISINDRETFEQLTGFIQKHAPVIKTLFTPSVDAALIHDILAIKPRKFYLIYRDAMEHPELAEAVPFSRFVNAVVSNYHVSQVGMVYCSGFIADRESYPELLQVRCPAGTTKLGVMPDGSVYPCNLFFGRAEFLLGNIHTDPFEAIWSHSTLAFFRTFVGNVCTQRTCELHEQCHGGCPAQAFLLTGDLAAPDPRCQRGLYLPSRKQKNLV